jgi:tRNA pseudouridine55 synthase
MTNPPSPNTLLAGIIPIDKPIGPTSMGVCRRVRWLLRKGLEGSGVPARSLKVGHAGTLDPMATGLVLVLVGNATRLCERLMHAPKRYLAEVDLAHTSESDDLEKAPQPAEIAAIPSLADLRAACDRFTGTIMQSPPAHSAIKVDGARAYTIARTGADLAMPARPVRIDACEIVSYDWPIAVLDVRCGRGTYIRSLARDLGRSLGVGGMLRGLRRTEVGMFHVEHALRFDTLPEPMGRAHVQEPPAWVMDLSSLPRQPNPPSEG